MNRIFFLLLIAIPQVLFGQNNTFPASGHVGIGTTSPGGKLEINYAGGQLKLTGGTVAGGVWTSSTDLLYLADWQTGLKGININMTNGNTGIGTNSPISLLHVNSSGPDVLRIQNQTGGLGNKAGLDFSTFSGTGKVARIEAIDQGGFNGDLAFYTDGDNINNSNVVERLRITSTGNIGIGTSAPTELLQVKSVLPYPRISVQSTSATGAPGYDIRDAAGNPKFTWHYDIAGGFTGFFQGVSGGNKMVIKDSGNVGIGTTNPNQKLTVNGTIYGKEVKVDLSVPGPDYVFDKDYQLTSLEDVKTYIDQHKHLPEVPSAAAMEANGINLSEMNMLLLKKVEELTLHLIEQNKEMSELKARNESLELKVNTIESKIINRK